MNTINLDEDDKNLISLKFEQNTGYAFNSQLVASAGMFRAALYAFSGEVRTTANRDTAKGITEGGRVTEMATN